MLCNAFFIVTEKSMIETYKIMRGNYDLDVCPEMRKDTNIKGTRVHGYKLFKRSCNTDLRKKFFTMRVVETWNGLREEVVEAKSMSA